MTRDQQVKHDIRHLTRRVWVAMLISIVLIIGWSLLVRAVYLHGKEAERVHDAR